ncbi:hypothetical protein AC578_9026 [Pseudocercospora eumusae]|uniref:Peptidase M16 N-terminal domain-containing protein n=1 Tax=Pseudocercospora eumusae TaxID=321146 RepID=A0A139GUK4_9PEZI|nr:hypothetical protein AC578_9026 [Pseudocercospora eumusae]KXS93873.1 hypothetical protein AC578_9026 [Pseudocercospora eumusae]
MATDSMPMPMPVPILHSRPEGPMDTERLADQLEKPLLDNRSYRVIRLPNKLEALLIHDPDTDKASAAMDVDVGSLADPEDMQGMAHAVEHLLFMGTEKFPGENDYNVYLSKYGGYSNAFTAPTSTNYYFELSSSSTSNSPISSANTSQSSLPLPKTKKHEAPLYGALDRFSQFFVAPLFLEATLDRELRAVDSENKKNLQADNWRMMQLNKATSSPHHPYHLFATGNYDILHDKPIERGVKIRDEFIKFYQKQYSANRMKLAVLGRESLDELQAWTEELFSAVPNKDLPKLRWDGIPVQTEKELGTQIFAKPVMDQRTMEISFPYPDEEHLYESQPARYISHLVGHEGPGSLLAYLKAKGWVSELSAGASTVCPGAAFFTIGMRLTTQGLANYQEIVKATFQYISMLKAEPPHKWIADEQAQLSEIEFRFRQKVPASRTTSHLSGVMQKPLPRDKLLSGQALIRKFDPEAIQRGLDCLTPSNFRFTLSAQDFPADFWTKKEKWYGTQYKIERIPGDLMTDLVDIIQTPTKRPSELHLPAKNEFIPQRLDVEKKEVSAPATTPKLIRNDRNVRLWFKKDDQFWVPKANIYVALRNAIIETSPFTAVVAMLYKELVDDGLTEYAYDAELAGLDYMVYRSPGRLELSVSGYNDKMHVLLEKVLIALRDHEVKEDRFEIIKERALRNFKNSEYADPFRQIHRFSQWIARDKHWTQLDYIEELPSVTIEDVRRFGKECLRQSHIEILAHGNLYKEDALRISNLVEATLKPQPLPKSQWEINRTTEFAPGVDYVYEHTLKNPENVNHCLEYNILLGNAQERDLRAKALLLEQMLTEPVFDTLRTKEQLGYIVGGGALMLITKIGYRILIQSEKDCDYLEQRTDSFLVKFEQELRDMSDKEFEEHKISVINKRLEKLKNLGQESGRLWHHICSEQFDFDLVYRDVEHIEPLTKDELLEFYQKKFLPGSSERCKYAIHLVAQSSPEDIAAKMDPAEQREKLADEIDKLMAESLQGATEMDKAGLVAEFEKVNIADGDMPTILSAVGRYLAANGMPEEVVSQILAEGEADLQQALPAAGIVPKHQPILKEGVSTNGSNASTETLEFKKNKLVHIKDVRAFKASLPLSAGPVAVKDITEFEELEPKL